jgi:3-isopropylmalate/(R)-2-methylmalate dehydratase small subunit
MTRSADSNAPDRPATDMAIVRVSGRGMTIRGNDIDTDQILPARFLKAITFKGMEEHVFVDAREAARGQGGCHPLDNPNFAGARILFVNQNFGCGSSREHAPQGLRRLGIAAIIGESFGEIFASNCVSVGMPCVQVSAEAVAWLQSVNEDAPETEFTLDLKNLVISGGNRRFPVSLPEGRRRQYLEGSWDATAVLLTAESAIEQTLARVGKNDLPTSGPAVP